MCVYVSICDCTMLKKIVIVLNKCLTAKRLWSSLISLRPFSIAPSLQTKKTTTILRLYYTGAEPLEPCIKAELSSPCVQPSLLRQGVGAAVPALLVVWELVHLVAVKEKDPTSLAIPKARDRLAYYLGGGGSSSIVMAPPKAMRQASFALSDVAPPGSWRTPRSRRPDHWSVQNYRRDLRPPSPLDQQPAPRSGDGGVALALAHRRATRGGVRCCGRWSPPCQGSVPGGGGRVSALRVCSGSRSICQTFF